jgi:hypothetical protein
LRQEAANLVRCGVSESNPVGCGGNGGISHG